MTGTCFARCDTRVLYASRAETYRQRLREFTSGLTSLVIRLVALAVAVALGYFLVTLLRGIPIGGIVCESLTIGGWVSMCSFVWQASLAIEVPHQRE